MTENIVGPMNQNIARLKQPALVLTAGIGAALAIMGLPHVYLENIVGAAGLPDLIPAASPPLGNTARGLVAAMACLVAASAVYYFLNRKGESQMTLALPENIEHADPMEQGQRKERKIRFGLPRFDARSLTRFLKKPKSDRARIMDLADLPQLRILSREDGEEYTGNYSEYSAFSETPVRAPIFAESEELPVDNLTSDDPVFEESVSAMEIPVEETVAETPPVEELPVEAVEETQADDLANLTIAQLAERLEAGLNRLKQLETVLVGDAPEAPTFAQPDYPQPQVSEPVATPINQARVHQDAGQRENMESSRQADMDAALKAALGTLEKMTAR
ncbi:MAG TPA: hypothetical protein VIN76_01990 [Parasphingorhabdus sp.]